MALEGSLKEFNVADILQLIFFQKKTGVLMLIGRTERVRVIFYDGNIISAESRSRGLERRLTWILVKRGLLNQEQLDDAMAKQREEGGKFLHHLIRDGVIELELMQSIIKFLIQEIMGRIFSMKEGRYEFKPQAVPVDKEIGISLNTEHFLMEGVRIVDEWSEIEGKIYLDEVFVRDEEEEVKLTENEERIFDYIDGVFDLADIADVTGIESFSVASTMLGLLEKNAVYRWAADEDVLAPEKIMPKSKPIKGMMPVMAILVTIAIAFACFYSYSIKSDFNNFYASEQLYKLRFELKIAKHESNAYPNAINELDAWGRGFIYSANQDIFFLKSAGADGKSGTPDDLF